MPLSNHLDTTHSLSKELEKIEWGERALTDSMIAPLQADARRTQQNTCVISMRKKQAVKEVLPIERAKLRKEEAELEVQRLYGAAMAAPVEDDVQGFLSRDYGMLFELNKMSRDENEVRKWAYWKEYRNSEGAAEDEEVEAAEDEDDDDSDGDEDYVDEADE